MASKNARHKKLQSDEKMENLFQLPRKIRRDTASLSSTVKVLLTVRSYILFKFSFVVPLNSGSDCNSNTCEDAG